MIRKHIPNSLTIANLLSGCLGIILTFEGNFIGATACIGAALIFDFGDGFAARLLQVHSPFGKELDSLADMITFGVLPTLMLYENMKIVACTPGVCTGLLSSQYFPYISFSFAACAALRLARFNISDDSSSFTGVPTPAAAMVVAAIPLIQLEESFLAPLLDSPKVFGITAIILAALMISDLKMISLKFKNADLKENAFRYTLIGGSILLAVIFQFSSIPFIFLLYLLLSYGEQLFTKDLT